jgi:hypothetical protein
MKIFILIILYFGATSAEAVNFRNCLSNYMMASPAQIEQAKNGQFELFSSIGSKKTDSTSGPAYGVHAALPKILNLRLGFTYLEDSVIRATPESELGNKDQTMIGRIAIPIGKHFRLGAASETKRRNFIDHTEETVTPSAAILINVAKAEFGVVYDGLGEQSIQFLGIDDLETETYQLPKRARIHGRMVILRTVVVGGEYGSSLEEEYPEVFWGAGITGQLARRIRMDIGYKAAQPKVFDQLLSIKRESGKASIAAMVNRNLNFLVTFERHRAGGASYSSRYQYEAEHQVDYLGTGIVMRL